MRKLISIAIFLTMALLIVGCQNPLTAPSGSASDKGLTITWTSNSANSRTILPANYPTPASYDVTLQPVVGSSITQTGLTSTSWTATNLAAAVYTITVIGKDSGGNAIVQGTGTADLTASASQNVAINLRYITQGTGTGQAHLTLDFSSCGETVTAVSLKLVDPVGSVSTQSVSGNAYANTALAVGSYKIFITATAASGKTAVKAESLVVVQNVDTAATISFTASDFAAAYVPVSSLTLNKSTTSLTTIQTETLTATPNGDASNPALIWTSSAPNVAGVSQSGVVTAHAMGSATITATAVDNGAVSASCAVTVLLAWTQIGTDSSHGGGGGDFAVIGSSIYVCNNSNLVVSTDNGATWTVTDFPYGDEVHAITADAGSLFVATNAGLAVSADGGTVWTNYTLTNGLWDNYVYDVAVSGSTICTAHYNRVSVSTNGGTNWTYYNLQTLAGVYDIRKIAVSGSTICVSTVSNGGMAVSTNTGATWTIYTTANGMGGVVSCVAVSGATLCAGTGNGLSISTNGGANWTTYTTAAGLGGNTVYDVNIIDGKIYAATSGGVSVTSDFGASWTNYNYGSLYDYGVMHVSAVGSVIYAQTAGDGLWMSDSTTPPPPASHTFADATTAILALTNGMTAAAMTTNTAATAYNSGSYPSLVYHFANYVNSGYTLTGTLSYVVNTTTYAVTMDGTVNFSGGDVTSVVYHNVTVSGASYSGTLTVTFADGSSWTYNYGTGSFTQN